MTMVTMPVAVIAGVVLALICSGSVEAATNDEMKEWIFLTVGGALVATLMACGIDTLMRFAIGG